MNKRNATFMLTLMLVVVAALASVAQGAETWERDFEVESGQKIDLTMKYGGGLEVEGWDKNVVRIICTESVNELDDYDFEVKETKHGLRFRAELDERQRKSTGLKVQLMVPRYFDVETSSGGGAIIITDVDGEFRGETAGGPIILHNVNGEAHLSSGGGTIEILDSDLDGRVSIGGGSGTLRNVTGNVKATSGGGFIKYENVRDRHGDLRGPEGISTKGIRQGTVMRSTAGGSINVKEAPDGAKVHTGGGDINVRNASFFVEAETGGGDVEIEIVDGYVTASTGAGDIEVIVSEGLGDSRDGVDLRTGHGEVTVILPADASVELDLDLSFTRNSSREFEITSDFDLDLEETQKWDTKNGSPRKHIYGTASVNGGRHKVVIHNVNGNIRIKKQ
jgi:DUF4097 and DUF4098 domain-containing protein YvlB